MTTVDEAVWELRWAAEISSRYHRKRAAWLNSVEFTFNLVQLLSATAAVVELTKGVPTYISLVGASIIALCSLLQVLCNIGKAAARHEVWMAEWLDLLTELDTIVVDSDSISRWRITRGRLNKEHVGELRALAVSAENDAATTLGIRGRQRRIGFFQNILKQLVTFQREFPTAPDVYLPMLPKG